MSNDNMLSNQTTVFDTEVKNKGFVLLDEIFKKHGWHMIKNEINWLCYTKLSHETEVFDIKIFKKEIRVSIPIKNSPYQYVSLFNSYFEASEYVETRLLDFIS